MTLSLVRSLSGNAKEGRTVKSSPLFFHLLNLQEEVAVLMVFWECL